ncbi:hypothetical protein CLOM_g1996 [Closterium sp. NIES-68]|nr:hypothetical protein CLOM_g1996 [Closterium sp. NIES-68]
MCIFRDFLDRFVIVFIDDVLIYNKSLDEHVHHIRQVPTRLRQHCLFVKQSKCEFPRSSIPFLGHIISHNQLSMDPSKVKAVQDWKPPTSIKELQAFLGLANYYQKFIQHFAAITSPLSNLLRKTEGFHWGPDENKAFEAIKQALTSSPTLALPNPSLPYTIWTYASSVAMGAILCQDQGHGLQPLAFGSRKLKPAECNYATHDCEMLAIVHAIKKWRCYVHMQPITVLTDHCTLQHFKTQPHLTPRQARWMEYLEQYVPELKIEYGAGRLNPAESLTRPPPSQLSAIGTVTWDENFISKFTKGYRRSGPRFASQPPITLHGQTERMNRTLEVGLRACVNACQNDWGLHLPDIEFSYNNTVNLATGQTPFYLATGQNPRTPSSLVHSPTRDTAATAFLSSKNIVIATARASLLRAQRRMIQYADQHRRDIHFKEGDQVLLSTANLPLLQEGLTRKLAPRFIGPFTITQVLSPLTYRLKLPSHINIHPVFHVQLLHPYHQPPSHFPSSSKPPPPMFTPSPDLSELG